MQQQRDRGFLNFVFAVATVHGCHYVSANSHVVVNHLWLLCIACKAKEAAARIPRLFLDPRWWCPVAAGYVCNFETKGELEVRERKRKRERKRDRESERADEQVPLDFNRFTTLVPPPLFFTPLSFFLFSYFLLLFFFSPLFVTRFNKLIRAGRPFFGLALACPSFLILIPLEPKKKKEKEL